MSANAINNVSTSTSQTLKLSIIIKHVAKRLLMTVITCVILPGCAKLYLGEKALGRNPLESPKTNITNFTPALECLDDLMLQLDISPVVLTAQDIPNLTGDSNSLTGAKDMLITSISKISERSKKINFVSYGTDLRDILLLHKSHKRKDDFITPDYFIRGAITQLDKNVLTTRLGGGLNHDDWNASFSGGQAISFAALDLNIGAISNLQILSGITSNNVLAVYDKGVGTDLGGRINTVGSFFDFGIDRRDGLGQAIRNLIDLGVIEVVGKLTDIPYMSCLPLNYNDPELISLIKKEYAQYTLQPEKLVKVVQYKLKKQDLYNGMIDGIAGKKTQLSILYYKKLLDLTLEKEDQVTVPPSQFNSSNRISFDTYHQIVYGQGYDWSDPSDHYIQSNKTPNNTNRPPSFSQPPRQNKSRPNESQQNAQRQASQTPSSQFQSQNQSQHQSQHQSQNQSQHPNRQHNQLQPHQHNADQYSEENHYYDEEMISISSKNVDVHSSKIEIHANKINVIENSNKPSTDSSSSGGRKIDGIRRPTSWQEIYKEYQPTENKNE